MKLAICLGVNYIYSDWLFAVDVINQDDQESAGLCHVSTGGGGSHVSRVSGWQSADPDPRVGQCRLPREEISSWCIQDLYKWQWTLERYILCYRSKLVYLLYDMHTDKQRFTLGSYRFMKTWTCLDFQGFGSACFS